MNPQTPLQLETERLILRMPDPDECAAPLRFYRKNRDYLADSMPQFSVGFFTEIYWREQLGKNISQYMTGASMRLFIYEKGSAAAGFTGAENIIGVVNLNEIVRRAAQFCYLGYGLDRDCMGQGFMTEAAGRLVRFAFDELNLHRVMANYVPSNVRSARVLARLGFVEEGFARKYLFLNGRWRDHVLTSLTNDNWDSQRA